MNNKTKSYRLKFWLPVSIFLIFASLLSSSVVFNYFCEINLLHKQTKQKIQSQMERLQLRLEALPRNEPHNIERELSYINLMPETKIIALIGTNGQVLTANNHHWKNKFAKDIFPEFDLNQYNKAQKNFQLTIQKNNQSNQYFVYTPISLSSSSGQLPLRGVGIFYLVYDNSLTYQAILRNALNQSVFSGILVMFSMALLLLIQRIILLKPLMRLIQYTEAIGQGDFSAANPLRGNGELMLFGQTLERTSQQLEQREQNFAITLDSIGDAVITTDVDGHVTHMNPIAEQITGWTLKEAKGLSLKIIFPIVDASTGEIVANPVDKVISTGETVHHSNNTTLIAKDKTQYQISDSAAPIRDADNNILGMVLVFNDVTEKFHIREKLRHSLQRLSLHWHDTPLGMIEWSTDFKFLDINPAAEQIFGFSKAEVLDQNVTTNILPENNRAMVEKVWADLLANKGGRHSVNENLTKDGRTIICEWYNTPLINEEGKVIGVSSLVMDITEKQKTEEKLKLSAKVFSKTNEGIIITNAKNIILDINPAFCKITGYSRDEVIGQSPNILSSGNQSPAFYTKMWQQLHEHGHWQDEIWNRNKKGMLYAELLSISSIKDEDGNVLNYVGIFTDITPIKKHQKILEHMAHYDGLTQLPNRALLADRFTQALAHSKRQKTTLAVCFLDLDNFKPVNDLYGHQMGDKLLVEVSKRIKASVRDEDTVSRQGGDEFALLLGDIESFSQCEQILKRIIESIAQPYIIDEQSLSVRASIGVSLYPEDSDDLDTLMRHADQAMYEAKLAGRNRFHLFNTEQDQQTTEKHIRLKEIQQALKNNEMCLYYQPKINMQTGEVFGFEALIRWTHPEKGLLPPFKFLPVIEDTDVEIQLGHWVINEALNQLDVWKKQGIEIEVSINISSYHLQSSSFVTDLEATLAKYPKVNSKYLQLEILESSVFGDIQSIRHNISNCIKKLGVNIALDDFGTGYSSLTHMRNLPARTIKIDQSFVRNMLAAPNDYAIIDGVIGLANSFHREVIAEGVETTEHGLMLLAMGCYKAQGYGIARPMPSFDIIEWLNNYTPNQEWLTCDNKVRTQKESNLNIFRLTLARWHKHFEDNIQSSPEFIEQWPLLNRNKCYCGIWIEQAKQEQLFDQAWLKELEKEHNALHDIAGDLFKKYQEGEIDSARKRIKHFQIAAENLNNILEKCE